MRLQACIATLTAAVAFGVACDDAAPEVRETATMPAAATSTSVSVTEAPPPSVPAATPTPIVVEELPIVDLHFHPEPSWGASLGMLFDRLGVKAAGNGASGPDSLAFALAEALPGRIIPFGGGHEARQLVSSRGELAWNLVADEAKRFIERLEADLRERRLLGIGEIHVNSRQSFLAGGPVFVYPADSPLMQRLWSLSVTYRVPLSVHMDAEEASVAQMERLLASDRNGVWLWAHTGHYAEPPLLRRLLQTHPNLYCELSYRSSISGSRTAIPIDAGGRLREPWRELLEEFPDRFVIGTDLGGPSFAAYTTHITFWRGILRQLSPETAAALAHLNADRLLTR